MFKEINALTAAKAALKNAERTLGNPQGFAQLRDAVRALLSVICGTTPRIEKDIARKLLLSCRSKAVEEVKVVLADVDACQTATLDHWRDVIDLFSDTGLDDDSEFSACRARLHEKRGSSSIAKFTSTELATLEKELQAALDCLSLHRRQLANIKWEIMK